MHPHLHYCRLGVHAGGDDRRDQHLVGLKEATAGDFIAFNSVNEALEALLACALVGRGGIRSLAGHA